MGTNYYMVTKDKDFVDKYFKGEYEFDEDSAAYEIHIGKHSSGWKPIFRMHSMAYNSVKEMKEFIIKHNMAIIAEYGSSLTLDDLQKCLFDLEIFEDKDKYWKFCNDFPFMCRGTENDYDLTAPIDQIEYFKLNPSDSVPKSDYVRDAEGYIFVKHDFC